MWEKSDICSNSNFLWGCLVSELKKTAFQFLNNITYIFKHIFIPISPNNVTKTKTTLGPKKVMPTKELILAILTIILTIKQDIYVFHT